MDPDLRRAFDIPKTSPDVVAARTYKAFEAGASEVMAEEGIQLVKANLSAKVAPYLIDTSN